MGQDKQLDQTAAVLAEALAGAGDGLLLPPREGPGGGTRWRATGFAAHAEQFNRFASYPEVIVETEEQALALYGLIAASEGQVALEEVAKVLPPNGRAQLQGLLGESFLLLRYCAARAIVCDAISATAVGEKFGLPMTEEEAKRRMRRGVPNIARP